MKGGRIVERGKGTFPDQSLREIEVWKILTLQPLSRCRILFLWKDFLLLMQRKSQGEMQDQDGKDYLYENLLWVIPWTLQELRMLS